MGTLNRKKPFAQVYGTASHAFEQEGKFFNNAGDEVDRKGNLIPKPVKPVVIEEKPVIESNDQQERADAYTPDQYLDEKGDIIGQEDNEDDGITNYGSREDIMARLDALNIPYNPKSRRTKLLELLPNTEG